MQWFTYSTLTVEEQMVAGPFYQLAVTICETIQSGPERTVALRKLLEAKDAAMRAKRTPGG